MCFYYLLLGHLVGDFTFQTNRIAERKSSELKWLIIHVLIVTCSMLIFVSPFGYKMFLPVLYIGMLHLVVDYLKSKIKSKDPIKSLILFIVDQSIHIAIIYLFSSTANSVVLPIEDTYIYLILALLWTVSVSSILIQFLLKIVEPKANRPFYMKNEKILGNLNRFLIFLSFYLSLQYSFYWMSMFVIVLTGFIIYYKRDLKKWMTLKYLVAKLIFEICFAGSGYIMYKIWIG